MNKINIHDLDFSNTNRYNIIRDKYNRIDNNGINHGRSIYYDKRKNKNIYGNVTEEEKKELSEEGIELTTIPWINNKDN